MKQLIPELFTKSIDKNGAHADILLDSKETKTMSDTTKADDQHAQRMEAELKAAPPLPEDNPDPFGMAFTQEEIDKLTDIDEASVKAAFANSTPEMRALLSTRQIDTNDAETPER